MLSEIRLSRLECGSRLISYGGRRERAAATESSENFLISLHYIVGVRQVVDWLPVSVSRAKINIRSAEEGANKKEREKVSSIVVLSPLLVSSLGLSSRLLDRPASENAWKRVVGRREGREER